MSQKTCEGILHRARKRGKTLPPGLKLALEIQAGIYRYSLSPQTLENSSAVYCLNDQGGQRLDCSSNQSGTLLAQTSHAPVVYENHGIDSRYTGPYTIAPTMSARYGTGGNNTPLVPTESVFCISGNIIDRQPQNGGNGCGYQENISYTITTVDRHGVCKPCQEIVGTLCRDDEKGIRNQYVAPDKSILENSCLIRRLTPLECERLQGFPDHWTDLPHASDSARYKALGNSVSIPCVEYVLHGITLALKSSA